MENSIAAEVQNVKVKFYPPLHEQRRAWVFDALRRESVTSLLDVGCGEGILLQHLTYTAPWRAYSSSTSAPAVFEMPDLIHLRDLHGLDIVHSKLLHAIDITEPPKNAYDWTRFEDLHVFIWEGGLQRPNAIFRGIDCIVATEVVEHLPEDVLTSFAPILLGNYAPRLLLLTTPSYDFNVYFSSPGDDYKWGFPDPTMRTDRKFRHSDHKFEWTFDECVAWCRAAAADWGYEVIIDGIGRSTTKDPWGRGSDEIYASQVVTFRRREGTEWDTRRALRYAQWASRRVERGQTHKLLCTHHYEAHAAAGKPASREDIVAAIKTAFHTIGAADVTIFELWREEQISVSCGGSLEVLVDVVDQDWSFVLHREGKDAEDWLVELPRGRGPCQDAWADTFEDTEVDGETYEDEEHSEELDDDEDEDEDQENQDEATRHDRTALSGWSTTGPQGWVSEWTPAPESEWFVETTRE
ncbi:hypothetical protein EI94DRAFT_1587199 [Lactarius quietus]|nr:hypothetical protein EI94DRAFT_1587199 [Lactarius quietus]